MSVHESQRGGGGTAPAGSGGPGPRSLPRAALWWSEEGTQLYALRSGPASRPAPPLGGGRSVSNSNGDVAVAPTVTQFSFAKVCLQGRSPRLLPPAPCARGSRAVRR